MPTKSPLYQRRLYQELSSPTVPTVMAKSNIPPATGWVNRVYCQSSNSMPQIPDNSIALVCTSPPYNVGKDYDDDLDLEEYLELIKQVGQEVYRVLIPGGRYVINITGIGRKPHIPLPAIFYPIHQALAFLPLGDIIWIKGAGVNRGCAWGSWKSAKAPCLRSVHEYLLVFAKETYIRPDTGTSDISSQEFMQSTLSVWQMQPAQASRIGHPAPFPLELPKRLIQLYTYQNDIVLDPFAGSGTTCIAAKQLHRRYVGIDRETTYCQLARKRLAATQATNTDLSK